jgi:hypothetical protein
MLYVGIDHSLTAFGLVAVRPDWEQNFRRVHRVTLTTSPKTAPVVERRYLLALDCVTWIRRLCERYAIPFTQVRAFIEGGIFMRGKADSIRSQERLAAVVEHELHICLGVAVEVIEQGHARSIFMGKSLARGRGAGDAAQELLRAVLPNPSAWDEAELDAFIVANAALYDAGWSFVSVATEAA